MKALEYLQIALERCLIVTRGSKYTIKQKMGFNLFLCDFGQHLTWCSGFTLAQHSVIIPGDAWGTAWGAGVEPRWTKQVPYLLCYSPVPHFI